MHRWASTVHMSRQKLVCQDMKAIVHWHIHINRYRKNYIISYIRIISCAYIYTEVWYAYIYEHRRALAVHIYEQKWSYIWAKMNRSSKEHHISAYRLEWVMADQNHSHWDEVTTEAEPYISWSNLNYKQPYYMYWSSWLITETTIHVLINTDAKFMCWSRNKTCVIKPDQNRGEILYIDPCWQKIKKTQVHLYWSKWSHSENKFSHMVYQSEILT